MVEYRVSCKNMPVAEKVFLANDPISRMVGLMFRSGLHEGEGLLIRPCNSIHTFFMRFNIDVLFLDKEYRVLKIIRNLRPWRMTRMYFKASQVLELQGGTLSEEIHENDQLEVLCTN
ncbi:MAG: DUF192 domain-containing protein [Bdellovibrionales bacterium]|nr:DUF192 domain-containing protein [Bdellovibrionales bacterium]